METFLYYLNITLDGNYSLIVNDLDTFKENAKVDIASELNVSTDSVTVVDVVSGSIIVFYEVNTDENNITTSMEALVNANLSSLTIANYSVVSASYEETVNTVTTASPTSTTTTTDVIPETFTTSTTTTIITTTNTPQPTTEPYYINFTNHCDEECEFPKHCVENIEGADCHCIHGLFSTNKTDNTCQLTNFSQTRALFIDVEFDADHLQANHTELHPHIETVFNEKLNETFLFHLTRMRSGSIHATARVTFQNDTKTHEEIEEFVQDISEHEFNVTGVNSHAPVEVHSRLYNQSGLEHSHSVISTPTTVSSPPEATRNTTESTKHRDMVIGLSVGAGLYCSLH